MQPNVAVITGSAQGIGAELARRCATRGYAVVVSDIDDALGETVAASIRDAGGRAIYQHADVAQEADLAALVGRAAATWGRLDLLVNNAHWEVRVPVTDLAVEQWDRSQAVLVRSHVLAAKHAVPVMRTQGGGNIVNISSVHGLAVTPNYATYEAGKAAVIHLTRQFARDLGLDGIRVNCICPGLIVTEIIGARLAAQPGRAELLKTLHPVRRLGTPGDIAEVVLFLASPAAGFITGQSIVVDGGMLLEMPLAIAGRIWDAQTAQAPSEQAGRRS
ncbi:MAG: SDR family oxidoreductase [Chloroflexi bacterium]|nr:SDR family oxidoreductase [Chloroflexota bacterium]